MKNRIDLSDVTAQMTRSSGPDGRPFRLRITDRASGVLIIEVEMDAEAFADLMSSSTAYGTASAALVEQYERVGRQRSIVTERPPKKLTDGVYDREKAKAAIEPWAEDRRAAVGADTYRIESHRDGYSVTLSTWAERTA